MYLSKRKNLAPKKENNYEMSLFLSLFLFSNQERFSSCQVLQCSSSTFFESFEKVCLETSVMDTILVKLWFFKIDSSMEQFFKFPETSKIFQTVNFFLLSFPINNQHQTFFILSTRMYHLHFEIFSSQKKSMKLERLLRKDKSCPNFFKLLQFK